MERIEEEVYSYEYRRYQHFITNSKWDHLGVIRDVQTQASVILVAQKEINGLPLGLFIDESSTTKKGNESIRVSRQYAGSVGKVENCQVCVYGALCNDTSTTLFHEKLFLPESWTGDAKKCECAGILEEHRKFKTKPQLALEIIDECVEKGVLFDWIVLYGHGGALTNELDESFFSC